MEIINRSKMKISSKIVACIMFLLLASTVQADLVDGPNFETEEEAFNAEKTVYVELLNGNAFPQYRFYVVCQLYDRRRDMPGAAVRIYFERGKPVLTGDNHGMSLIYATGRDGEYQSDTEVGGYEFVEESGVEYVLQRIRITAVTDQGIAYEEVDRQLIGKHGKVLHAIKKGSVATKGKGNVQLLVLPIVCFVALLCFVLVRRRIPAQQPVA